MNPDIWFIQLQAWQVMLIGTLFFAAIYAGGAAFTALLTHFFARFGFGVPLDRRPIQPEQLRREWRQSASSILIFGAGLVVPWGLLKMGWAKLLPNGSGWMLLLEVLFLLLWNEVHFWINHYLLHTRWLIRYHGAHHRSVVTTPWSTYSFHPVEALMLGSVILLPMLLHDFSFWALASLPVLSLVLNLVGHSNWDFFPWAADTRLWAASRRHHHHHASPRGNYGFALPYIDMLMGTQVRNPMKPKPGP